jgi:hypothetical protein
MSTPTEDLAAAGMRLASSTAAEIAAAGTPRWQTVVVSAQQRAFYAYDVPQQPDGTYLLGPPGAAAVASIWQVFVTDRGAQLLCSRLLNQGVEYEVLSSGAVSAITPYSFALKPRVDMFGWI